MKTLIASSLILLFAIVSFETAHSNPPAPDGKKLYERKCARCHGDDGTLEKKGADNLKKSDLNDEGLLSIITDGKKKMPAFSKKLTPEEIKAVANYTKTLRK